MIEKKTFKHKNIIFDFRYNTEFEGRMPVIIFFHGFKSFRNWGFIPYLCKEISRNGFIVINPDFEYNGIISENPVDIDAEKFSQNTVSKEFQNASDLIELISGKNSENESLVQFLNEKWDGRIHLVGHSRGGGIALLAALKFHQIDKLGLLAPIGFFDRYTERLKTKWLNDGFLEFNDPMSKQKLRMNSTYLIDLLENKDEYDLIKNVGKLKNEITIIHGENDVSVPLEEVQQLLSSLEKRNIDFADAPIFNLLEKTNHLFNVSHPFVSTNQHLDKVCDLLIKFLKD